MEEPRIRILLVDDHDVYAVFFVACFRANLTSLSSGKLRTARMGLQEQKSFSPTSF